MSTLKPDQLTQGGAAGQSVHRESGVALKLRKGRRRVVAKDAVHPPGVKAQAAEAQLKLSHVVTAEHFGPSVQVAVAQVETGFYQRVPG
jgi:hypothetical protein